MAMRVRKTHGTPLALMGRQEPYLVTKYAPLWLDRRNQTPGQRKFRNQSKQEETPKEALAKGKKFSSDSVAIPPEPTKPERTPQNNEDRLLPKYHDSVKAARELEYHVHLHPQATEDRILKKGLGPQQSRPLPTETDSDNDEQLMQDFGYMAKVTINGGEFNKFKHDISSRKLNLFYRSLGQNRCRIAISV
ncbi:MAG: hypothetical protein M1822_004522 [Bathelium mastoideum]|nr:MAG: hypothetical protein M1822_004522 [Bathelium mastoideum]